MNQGIPFAASLLLAICPAAIQAADFSAFINRGTALADAGDCKGSEHVFAEALKSAPPDINPYALAPIWNGLGLALDTQGRYAESERFFRKTLIAIESAKGTENPEYAAALANLGGSLLGQEQLRSAESAIREAIRIHVRSGPPKSRVLAMARAGLVQILIAKRAGESAEPIARQAIADLSGPEDIQRGGHAMALNNLAVIRSEQGYAAEAADILRRVVAEIESNLGPDHPLLVQGLSNLAAAYIAMGQRKGVESLFERALAINESRAGRGSSIYASILMNYSEFLRRTGRKKESAVIRARSREASSENARMNGIGSRLDVSSFRGQGR